MTHDLTTREGRERYINFCFNVIGSGFGEEVNQSIKNKQCVKDFIDGLIDVDTLASRIVTERNQTKKYKITPEQLDENMKRLQKAEAIAKLDNRSKVSPETRALLDKLVTGEMTGDEVVDEILKRNQN